MGRSRGFRLLLSGQQFATRVFDSCIRESLSCVIYVGNSISSEEKQMYFMGEDLVDPSVHLPRFTGYVTNSGAGVTIIQTPIVSDPEKLKQLLIIKGNAWCNARKG